MRVSRRDGSDPSGQDYLILAGGGPNSLTVVGIRDRSDPGADALVGEGIGERDRGVLRPGVRVADQLAAHDGVTFAAALPQRHLPRDVDELDGLGRSDIT